MCITSTTVDSTIYNYVSEDPFQMLMGCTVQCIHLNVQILYIIGSQNRVLQSFVCTILIGCVIYVCLVWLGIMGYYMFMKVSFKQQGIKMKQSFFKVFHFIAPHFLHCLTSPLNEGTSCSSATDIS